MREEVLLIAGPKFEDDAELLIGTVNRVVGGYLKGQTIASLATGTLATIGLAIFHVPYALVLGILTVFLNYIPYVGPFIAGFVAGLVGLFVSPLDVDSPRWWSSWSLRTSPTRSSRPG